MARLDGAFDMVLDVRAWQANVSGDRQLRLSALTWVMLMHGKNHVRSLVRLRLTRVVDLLKIR